MDKFVLGSGHRRVADARRYADLYLVARARGLRGGLVVGLLLFSVASVLPPLASGQNPPVTHSELVVVYSDHFEAEGKRFDSAEALRKYLEIASTRFTGVDVRECGAQERIREATNAIMDVETKRVVDAGGKKPDAFQMEIASVPCPRHESAH